MNTKWQGLWIQERPEVYASKVIKKSDIPAYTRIVVRNNIYYKKDSNRPKFVYCFADSKGYEEKCIPLELENDDEGQEEKIKELAELLCEANYCPVMLPSESQARAKMLKQAAIELIEEMTGQEWRFEYHTW